MYILFGVAMIGKFSVSASLAIIQVYSNEIFPTSINSTCTVSNN